MRRSPSTPSASSNLEEELVSEIAFIIEPYGAGRLHREACKKGEEIIEYLRGKGVINNG